MANCECCGKENARYIRQVWTPETLMQPPRSFCNYKCADAWDHSSDEDENKVTEYGFSGMRGF